MKFYNQILGRSQLKLLVTLGPFMTRNSCYLGGDTAIALMLGHRRSVDLDWFSGKPIGDPDAWIEKIKGTDLILRRVDVSKGTLYATSSGVRFSLIEYRYPRLQPPVL